LAERIGEYDDVAALAGWCIPLSDVAEKDAAVSGVRLSRHERRSSRLTSRLRWLG